MKTSILFAVTLAMTAGCSKSEPAPTVAAEPAMFHGVKVGEVGRLKSAAGGGPVWIVKDKARFDQITGYANVDNDSMMRLLQENAKTYPSGTEVKLLEIKGLDVRVKTMDGDFGVSGWAWGTMFFPK